MKKKLNEAAIRNELAEGSLYFQRATTAVAEREAAAPNAVSSRDAPVALEAAERLTQTAPDTVRASVRPYARTPVRRVLRRHPFEFYQDQIETLKQFSLSEQLNGDKGSMSEMVREAVDEYIGHRRKAAASHTKLQPSVRTAE